MEHRGKLLGRTGGEQDGGRVKLQEKVSGFSEERRRQIQVLESLFINYYNHSKVVETGSWPSNLYQSH